MHSASFDLKLAYQGGTEDASRPALRHEDPARVQLGLDHRLIELLRVELQCSVQKDPQSHLATNCTPSQTVTRTHPTEKESSMLYMYSPACRM